MSKCALTRWELFIWSALIQRLDQTVDRQTQGCDLIFKGPLQTLLICRPKRLIRQGSELQTCSVVNAQAPVQPVGSGIHTSLSWRELPASADYICELCSSWQLPYRCFSSTLPLWKITHLSADKNAFRNILATPNSVLDRFQLLINVFLVTDTDRKGTVFT